MVTGQTKHDTLSVILGGGRGTRLHPLTQLRAKPAVPLGGKYRLIDVPISNCLNSGLNRIYVLTQFLSASMHRHVQGSFQFDRFGGAFVEILAAMETQEGGNWYQGTADAVRRNLVHFGNQWQEILILSGDQLYQMNFEHLLEHHRRSKADMSIAVLPVNAADAAGFGILKVNEAGRVVSFHEKPKPNQLAGLETDASLFRHFKIDAPGRPYLASMGIYVFNREVLYDELTEHGYVDFGKDLFPSCIHKHRVQAFLYDGYWEDIGTVKSFHEANLEMAKPTARFRFDTDFGAVYTRPRNLAGSTAHRLSATDSIVTDGCRIEDLTLENSILGLRSIVGANVRLKRTLVMGADSYETEADRAENRRHGRPDIGIGNNVVIENAIVDKNVRIGNNVSIRNPEQVMPAEGKFYIVRDGVICILKGAVVPSGTRIGG